MKNKQLRIAGLVAAALFVAFGRYPLSMLVSSRRKYPPPIKIPPRSSHSLRCPSGNTIYVEIDGPIDAHPLVLIHGLNSSRLQWFYQHSLLRDSYRLILIDLPGHGLSPLPADLSLPTLAADLQYILLQLQLKNAILYGHSIGAMVIEQYCVNYNVPKPKAIILQQASYTDPLRFVQFAPLIKLIQKPILEPFLKFVKRHPGIFAAIRWFNYLNGLSILFHRYWFFTGNQSAAQLRFISRLAATCPPQVVAEGILKVAEFDISKDLLKISVPCLVFAGSADRIVKPCTGKYVAMHIPNSRLVILKGGHLALIENPQDTNTAVTTFLNSLDG